MGSGKIALAYRYVADCSGSGPLTAAWDAVALFVASSFVTLCFGHSVGMHRKLIHGSFNCPLWVERACVYLGTLVGMAGPIGMICLHDHRDWAQRQPACHRFSRHDATFLRDAWWQLHCRLELRHPPRFQLEPRLANDRFYAFIERTWMWQQMPWAALFYLIGGWRNRSRCCGAGGSALSYPRFTSRCRGGGRRRTSRPCRSSCAQECEGGCTRVGVAAALVRA